MNFIQPTMNYVYGYYPTIAQSTDAPPLTRTLKRRLFQGFIDLIGIVISFVIFAIVYFGTEPRIRFMTCQMDDISFPKLPDIVAEWVVLIFGFLVPVAGIIIIEGINTVLFKVNADGSSPSKSIRLRRFFITVFHGLSLFLLGCGITVLLTESNIIFIKY